MKFFYFFLLKATSYKLQARGGYALTLAIVVSSVVLSIGLSLLNIVQKELILSATGRDSQFAFYAADAGLECVLYWDLGNPTGSIFPESSIDDDAPPAVGTMCGTTDLSSDKADWDATIEDCPPVGECHEYAPARLDEGGNEIPASGYEDDTATIVFQVEFTEEVENVSPGSCTRIEITKAGNGDTGEEYGVETTVEARGYNDGCPASLAAGFDNPALVERGVSVSYGGD
ncbi:hypothetical protein A3A38_02905 [Candidatus Kaiserbacteria bacterium RIFCSPLOWO2_01_FULL_53_17]|uniref:Type 4 fimbrial biogenesis protein PilX N-terminal domain-containing protein n=1 Tax=Candidatus Kaiserbacteria bacterium RIFCSPLOWO2_01_FULL_53_17 TaxID=1798511 RepID=A0A1F6EG24_9BACT|nr:MAG: hypothetical protein A3A38_02905 [Candidatus Kaiserbacteria bacterium RIFCSPLOWO2_01_FULL_53_17]